MRLKFLTREESRDAKTNTDYRLEIFELFRRENFRKGYIFNLHTPDRFAPHTPVAQKIRADSSLIRQKIGTFFI